MRFLRNSVVDRGRLQHIDFATHESFEVDTRELGQDDESSVLTRVFRSLPPAAVCLKEAQAVDDFSSQNQLLPAMVLGSHTRAEKLMAGANIVMGVVVAGVATLVYTAARAGGIKRSDDEARRPCKPGN